MDEPVYILSAMIIILLCVLTSIYIIKYGNLNTSSQSVNKEPVIENEDMVEIKDSGAYLIKLHGHDLTIESSVKTNVSCKKFVTIIEWMYIKADDHILAYDIFNVMGILAESNEGVVMVTTKCNQTTYRYVGTYDPSSKILNISILNNDLTPVRLGGKLTISIVLCGFGNGCNKVPHEFKIDNVGGGPIGCR